MVTRTAASGSLVVPELEKQLNVTVQQAWECLDVGSLKKSWKLVPVRSHQETCSEISTLTLSCINIQKYLLYMYQRTTLLTIGLLDKVGTWQAF